MARVYLDSVQQGTEDSWLAPHDSYRRHRLLSRVCWSILDSVGVRYGGLVDVAEVEMDERCVVWWASIPFRKLPNSLHHEDHDRMIS